MAGHPRFRGREGGFQDLRWCLGGGLRPAGQIWDVCIPNWRLTPSGRESKINIEQTGIQASRPEESTLPVSVRTASPVPRCKMSKVITNAAYRKSRGTDKPFSGSDQQANAIWIESIRRDKWHSARAASPAKPAPQPAE